MSRTVQDKNVNAIDDVVNKFNESSVKLAEELYRSLHNMSVSAKYTSLRETYGSMMFNLLELLIEIILVARLLKYIPAVIDALSKVCDVKEILQTIFKGRLAAASRVKVLIHDIYSKSIDNSKLYDPE